jgi:hypothetical protein
VKFSLLPLVPSPGRRGKINLNIKINQMYQTCFFMNQLLGYIRLI